MEKKEKNTFGKIPNRPYFVWIVIVCAIIMLVSLPRGGAGKIQTLDTKQLMTAVQNDSLLEISIRKKRLAAGNFHSQRPLRREGLVRCGGQDEKSRLWP